MIDNYLAFRYFLIFLMLGMIVMVYLLSQETMDDLLSYFSNRYADWYWGK